MPRIRSLAVVAVAGGIAAALVVPGAGASSGDPRPAVVTAPAAGRAADTGELSVALELRSDAAHHQAIASLSAAAGQRDRSAARLPATSAQRLTVLTWASEHGFTIGYSSASTVVLEGPAAALASAFGTTLAPVSFGGARHSVARGALVVPAPLAGVVARATGLDDRPVFHRLGQFGPSDVRSMENVPNRTTAPLGGGRGVTVGIVALHPWTSSDVTTWAADPLGDGSHRDAIPLAAGQITEVPVDVTSTVDPKTTPGAEEVALDAEAVLAEAPSARQRIYFGGSSGTSYLAVIDQMTRDAQAGLLQVATTSWGGCEPDLRPSTIVALSEAIDRLVATGVTFFAASGDSDGYACSSRSAVDNTPNVSVPSDAPNATAVGGVGTSSPNGTAPGSWSYTAWGAPYDATKANATPPQYMGDGADGGYSYVFSAPTWQNRYFNRSNTATVDYSRAVPDIAGLADPASGFVSYATSTTGSRYFVAGGTSLAAPLSAGAEADVLATTANPSFGFGNINPVLWANPQAVRDVTAGANAVGSAVVGWDPPTGLGVPDWAALAPLVAANDTLTLTAPGHTSRATVPLTVSGPTASFTNFQVVDSRDSTAGGCAANGSATLPTSYTFRETGTYTLVLLARDQRGRCRAFRSAPIVYDTNPTIHGSLSVSFAFGSSDPVRLQWAFPFSDVDHYALSVQDVTTGQFVIDHATTGTEQSRFLRYEPGHAYAAQVDLLTRGGELGRASLGYLVPVAPSQTTRRGFTLIRNGHTDGGSYALGARRGATCSYRFAGSAMTLGFLASPRGGLVTVLVDGRPVRSLDLYRRAVSFQGPSVLVRFPTTGTHTITVRAEGKRRHPGRGTDVGLLFLFPQA